MRPDYTTQRSSQVERFLILALAALLALSFVAAFLPASRPSAAAHAIEPEMVRIAGGEVRIGDRGWRHTTPRTVEIAPFLLAAREVSRGEFLAFASATGGLRPGEQTEPANLPMTGVRWDRAQTYADWLKAETGKPYRLPRADEWEAALRLAGAGLYEWGDSEPQAAAPRANLADASALRRYGVFRPRGLFELAERGYDDGHAGLAPPGSFAPNRLGLYDMTGNAAEWCSDEFVTDDRRGPGTFRAIRGSSFVTRRLEHARTAWLIAVPADTRHIAIGFRIARSE